MNSTGALTVSRVLHAGYIFKTDKTQIIFDPIFEIPFSHNCFPFPKVEFLVDEVRNQRFDAVFISHFHDDHCSLESLNFINRNTPIFIYCVFNDIIEMIRRLGFVKVIPLNLGQTIEVGDFKVTTHQALDKDVDSIFQIQALGFNILNVVDSWIDDDTFSRLSELSPWDLVLWPFQTMRELEVLSPLRAEPAVQSLPPEWLAQLKRLAPKNIIPSSCQFIHEEHSWYNHTLFPITYEQFASEVSSILPEANVFRLNPGCSVVLNPESLKKGESLSWVIPVGDQNVDYVYDSRLEIPKTSAISSHFSELSSDELTRVHHYFENEILKIYPELEEPEEDLFKKSIIWKVSIYNQQGQPKSYCYKIQNQKIEIIKEVQHSWLTEVPASKVFSALENGESLTSMYIRINDELFDSKMEAQLKNIDPTLDPLIRCLFSKSPGHYQKAQLARLNSIPF